MPSRLIIRTVIVLAILALVATALPAQEWAGQGRLQGRVLDQEGEPIEGAQVKLNHETGGGPDEVLVTDDNGRWSYLGLAGGSWTIVIEAEGFVPSEGSARVIERGFGPGQTITVKLRPITEEMQRQAEEAAGADIMTLINTANQQLQSGQYAASRESYEKALEMLNEEEHANEMSQILNAIADTYASEGDVDQALAILDRSLAVAPADNPAARAATLRTKAQILAKSGQEDEAVATLEQVLQSAPDDPDTLRILASMLIDLGREEEAETYLARLPEGTTLDPDRVLNVGIKRLNAGQTEEALAMFERAVKENPDLADAYYYRGLAYMQTDKPAEALADFRKLLEMAPDHASAGEAQQFVDYLETQVPAEGE